MGGPAAVAAIALDGPVGDQVEAMVADMYGWLRGLRTHGDMVVVDLGGIPTVLLYDLDDIAVVLGDKLDHVGRPAVFDRLAAVMGSGLITNYDWDEWFPHRRRIVQPLGARSVGRFHDRMVTIIEEELASWPTGEIFELHERVKRLTLRVVADLLFTSDLDDDAVECIDRAVQEIHAWAEADPAYTDPDNPPPSYEAAVAALDEFIDAVIEARDPASPGDDMVGLLLAATADPEARLDRRGVRDEAVTLILAGHETVTNTICFALDLLARNPEVADADARHVVDETLRLYPPVHVTNKAIVKDMVVGDVTIPAGWEVLIPEYVLYRDPVHFERPDEFLPDRWDEGSTLHLDRRAYFPFLTGPKFCVGRHFAVLEATETIDRFRRRFVHRMLDDTAPWGRELATSFAPDRPMPVRLEPR